MRYLCPIRYSYTKFVEFLCHVSFSNTKFVFFVDVFSCQNASIPSGIFILWWMFLIKTKQTDNDLQIALLCQKGR